MRHLTFTSLVFLLCAGTLLADNPSPNAASAGRTIVPADWQSLHERWQTAARELKIPGLAIVAVRGDETVLLDTLGVCDPDGKQAVTPHSPFYLASVTKSFTALGVAILANEGKVDLDAPVRKYLPRFTLADESLAEKITVRDLLSHRYGLDSGPIGVAEAYFGNMTDERYYRLLALVEPQGKFSYSNLHYTLAGRVIEAVSGQRWQDFLAQRVFAPLEMTDATCYASKLYANPLAAWPIVEKDGAWQLAPLVKNDSVMHAAGGMGASASDMANWLRFQLTGKTPQGTRLVSPELLRDIQTQQVNDEDDGRDFAPNVTREGYSLGWFTGKFQGRQFLTHGGGYLGTATYVSFLPQERIGVVVLMNEGPPNGLFPMVVANDIYGKLLGETLPDLLPAARQMSANVRKRMSERTELEWHDLRADGGLSRPAHEYAGTYENPFWGQLQAATVGETVRLHVGQVSLRSHGMGDDHFRMELPTGEVLEGAFVISDGRVSGLTVTTPEGAAEFNRLK